MRYLDPVADQAALLSLVCTMRRLAHHYKSWAMEAERAGKMDAYWKWRRQSDQCWQNAHWYLRFAQNRRA